MYYITSIYQELIYDIINAFLKKILSFFQTSYLLTPLLYPLKLLRCFHHQNNLIFPLITKGTIYGNFLLIHSQKLIYQ